MTVTLVLPENISDELKQAMTEPVETAGVLLVRYVETPQGNVRLLARGIHWVSEGAYQLRTSSRLSVSSEGYVPSLSAAESDGAMPIWLHTHPGVGSTPTPSKLDEIVDQQLADVFRTRSGSDYYGALVLARAGSLLRFCGHIESQDERFEIDRMWSTGRRLAFARSASARVPALSGEFDRNVRAFGGDIQRVLGNLRVAVVGCGGTGSAVAEQLIRLGVRHFILCDPESLTESNVTRVYGSGQGDIGRPKVEVAAANLLKIAPDAEVRTLPSSIIRESAAKFLLDADLAFGCTDDNSGRLVLSRLASYTLTPVIDCGVLLNSGDHGELEGINGRVTLLGPGMPCLVCRGRIDFARAAAESLSSEERVLRVREGYAPELEGIEPAVVTFTTNVAAAAVSELLERLIRYGPEPAPSEILLRLHEREISTNDQAPVIGHYCHPDAGKLGLGLTEPFLEQTWIS